MKVLYPITFLLFIKTVSNQVLDCGPPAFGHNNMTTTLKCNTSSPITELYWGVKLAEEPNPVLIIVDPSGERPGVNIGSTNYGGRVSFVGNRATGDASIEIRNLLASDAKEYLWKVDHGGGLYKRYAMSLTVSPQLQTTTPTSTMQTTPFTTAPVTTLTTTAEGNQTTSAPTTEQTDETGLSVAEKAGIAVGAIVGVIILAGITYFICKKGTVCFLCAKNDEKEHDQTDDNKSGKSGDVMLKSASPKEGNEVA